MHNTRNPQVSPDVPPSDSFSVLVSRIFWMLIGPITLALLAFGIVRAGTGWLTGLDVAFFVVLGLIVGARAIEQRSGQGATAEGKPSTWEHVRRYYFRLIAVAAALWLVANLFGNHILAGERGQWGDVHFSQQIGQTGKGDVPPVGP